MVNDYYANIYHNVCQLHLSRCPECSPDLFSCRLLVSPSCCGYIPQTLWIPARQHASVPCAPAASEGRPQPFKRLALEMTATAVRINGRTVLKANAWQLFSLFTVLWNQFYTDLAQATFTLLTLEAIADRMPGCMDDLDTLRRYIKRADAVIRHALSDLVIPANAIIRSARIKAIGRKKQGYGLNPETLAIIPSSGAAE